MLGCRLVGTDVFDGDDLLLLSDRHVDVIVCDYPPETADFALLTSAGRRLLRASLENRFEVVLRAFDPRPRIADLAE